MNVVVGRVIGEHRSMYSVPAQRHNHMGNPVTLGNPVT